MAFSGYLIKLGGSGGTVLPLSYMQYESYKVKPSQMLDLDSTRNTTGTLVRKVLSHTASKITFNTPIMNGTKHDALMTLLLGSMISTQDHSITLYYWDDTNCAYKTGKFYMVDPEWTIININTSTNERMYKETTLSFVEY